MDVACRETLHHRGTRAGGEDAAQSEVVNQQRPAAAGRRHDADAVALGRLTPHHERRHFDQRLEHVDAHHAVLAQERFDGGAAADDGPGMGRRKLVAGRAAPQQIGDDRLFRGEGAAGHPRKCPGVADGFEEQQDCVGVRVVDQQVADLAHAQIRLVADRDHFRKPEAAALRTREEGAQQATALRQQRHATFQQLRNLQHLVGRKGNLLVRVDDPEAVGAEDPHAFAPRGIDDAVLERPPILAGLGKARAEDGGAGHAVCGALRDRIGHQPRREHDERMVHRPRNCVDGRIGAFAENLAAARIDRKDRAAKTMLAEIALGQRGVLALVRGRADQRDAFRREQRVGEARAASWARMIGHPVPF